MIFADMLLTGWAAWASDEPGPSPPSAAGRVLQIASVRDGDYVMRLTDDEMTAVDCQVAILVTRFRQIIELEYRCWWCGRRQLLTQEQKWRKLGLKYQAYGDRLTEAKRTLFKAVKGTLARHVESWRTRPNR